MRGFLQISSSPTSIVPYSSADTLIGNDLSKSTKSEEDKEFLEYSKDKIESIGDVEEHTIRRHVNKAPQLNSRAIDKVNLRRDSDDIPRSGHFHSQPAKTFLQYRQNGSRSSIVKGEPLFTSGRPYVSCSGTNSDELIAMGTLWSPNSHSQPTKPVNTSSNSFSIMNNSASSRGVPLSSSCSTSSTGLGYQTQQKVRYTNTVRPIMVNSRSNKDVEPKYVDPVLGAPTLFQQRLMELSALEAETIRYERNKKVKKKVKQDRDS